MNKWKQTIVRVWHKRPCKGGEFLGTAFLISPNHLITASHVVKDLSSDKLYLQGPPWSGLRAIETIRHHPKPEIDIAVLTLKMAIDISKYVIPLATFEQAKAQVGQCVTLAGYSTEDADLEIVSLEISSYEGIYGLLVTHTSVDKGMSGGPVLVNDSLAGIIIAHKLGLKSYLLPLNEFRYFVIPYANDETVTDSEEENIPSAYLQIVDGPISKKFRIKKSQVIIGRNEDCDIKLPDKRKKVSRYHAKLSFSEGYFWLTDKSKNGTFLVTHDQFEHREKLAPGNTVRLKTGTQLKIGNYILEFVQADFKQISSKI